MPLQNEAASFQYQTAIRMMEYLVLELAMEEITNDFKVWECCQSCADENAMDLGQNEEDPQYLDVNVTRKDEKIVV
jgi:hypothetical protein